ncbi:MAG: hypothetical protein ACK57N_02360 [Planctomycetia bacterium]
MPNDPEEPFREAHLDSPEYRERLMRKLNCLIAVLEVATAKVERTLQVPDADVDRLGRIRTNLRGTLDVCLRARAALERREALPANLPENLAAVVRETAHEMKQPLRRAQTGEFSSEAERRKFRLLRPIAKEEVKMTDLEDLIRRLQAG